jgi:hypothetical protein
MREKRKAKFRVGQVLCFPKLPNGDYFFRVVEVSTEPNEVTHCFEYSDGTEWWQEIGLRRLTARERGAAEQSGKGERGMSKQRAILECAIWLHWLLSIGWKKRELDALERVWWTYHTKEGKCLLAQHAHPHVPVQP